MKCRRNAPLTDAQINALKGILSAHSAPATNPKRKGKRRAARRTSKKRRLSPSHLRKLRANLRKARAAKRRGK